MIEASKNHTFQYVLVYKLDRFSRSRYDSAIYKKILSDNGVRVISATENIGENPEGIILEAIWKVTANTIPRNSPRRSSEETTIPEARGFSRAER